MRKNQITQFLLLIFIIALSGCDMNRKKTENKDYTSKEDFDQFSKAFFTDSLFQMSRINFPLAGPHSLNVGSTFGDSIYSEWKEENWVMIKKLFQNQDSIIKIGQNVYKRRINKTDSLVEERIFIENSGFEELQKFVLKDGKWYLSYYSIANY